MRLTMRFLPRATGHVEVAEEEEEEKEEEEEEENDPHFSALPPRYPPHLENIPPRLSDPGQMTNRCLEEITFKSIHTGV